MKKSIVLVFLLAVAVTTGASVAAVMLTELPVTNAGVSNTGGALYTVQGITDDGAYVVASKLDGTTNHVAYIKVSDGPTGTPTYLTGRQAGGRGIAYTTAGGTYKLASGACAEANIPTNPLALGANAGATTTTYLNTSNEALVAHQNAMALDPVSGDGWLVGERDTHGNQGFAWKVTAGAINVTPVWNRTGGASGNLGWAGVSTTGVAVGTDDVQPLLANVALSTSNVTAIPAYPGGRISGDGSYKPAGNGISNNAAFATGVFITAAGDSDHLHAFRHTLGDSTVELMPAGGDAPLVTQQSVGFDVADDGTVGGFSYNAVDGGGNTIAGYRATIWLPGSTAGSLLQDILAANGVGMGDFAYLERVISVTNDGKTFAGRGVLTSDGSYRGFVVTIPEPATMSFLALGGLALLRRRH